ncbi:hypothetical protein GCM10020331_030650 [Ectobacillus funiculus]
METKQQLLILYQSVIFFIHAIKMIVMPIVIAALVVAVASVGDMKKKLGKLGGKTILYFEIVTTIALGLGLLAANLFHPGSGVDTTHLAKRGYLSIRTNGNRHTKEWFLRKQSFISFQKRL